MHKAEYARYIQVCSDHSKLSTFQFLNLYEGASDSISLKELARNKSVLLVAGCHISVKTSIHVLSCFFKVGEMRPACQVM